MGFFQGLSQLTVLAHNFSHSLSKSVFFFLHFFDLFFQRVDESQVIQCYIVVVVFNITELFLVIFHECVYLSVLAFFDFVYFCLPTEFQNITFFTHFLFELSNNLIRTPFKVFPHISHLFIMSRDQLSHVILMPFFSSRMTFSWAVTS